MKANIDAAGTLTIEPETPLESYALQKWSAENYKDGEIGNIIFVHDYSKVGSPFAAGGE